MHDPDEISNPSDNPRFMDIVNSRATRRGFLAGSLGAAALTFIGSSQANSTPHHPNKGPGNHHGEDNHGKDNGRGADKGRIAFTSIPLDGGPMPTIAPEYAIAAILPWREKIDGSGRSYPYGLTSQQQEQAIGLGHDGMWLFDDEVLCLNLEHATNFHMFGREEVRSLEEVRTVQAAHGVAVVALERCGDKWSMQADRRNRRIHVNTPVKFSGPVKGSTLLKVNVNNDNPKGTISNCSMGHTPWGTYLTCEENFHQYFGATAAAWTPTTEQRRVGLSAGQGWDWHKFDERFDLSQNAGEEHRFGWVVEIDPQKPNQKPIKRTAIGRFKHEGATVVEGRDKRVVVYSGDDERNEYVYKFVSAGTWKSMFARGIHPLDEGILYVAEFNQDGSGKWLELSPKNPQLAGWTLDRILVHTRLAADLAGATKMDRPEWITVGTNEEVFCTLTNNTSPDAENRPGNPSGPNPDGHIIKWVDSDQHTGTRFQWDFFAIAADVKDEEGQMFGSPDGIWADQKGRVFVETNGRQPGSNNDQLLVADQKTAQFKRLMTGVKGGEVTGITVAKKQRVMFANIQHPGNGDPAVTNFPEQPTGATGPVPRDATLVIVRKDGGIIGS